MLHKQHFTYLAALFPTAADEGEGTVPVLQKVRLRNIQNIETEVVEVLLVEGIYLTRAVQHVRYTWERGFSNTCVIPRREGLVTRVLYLGERV